MQGYPIKKYDIYEFTIRDNEYYPDGMNVLLANDKDYKAINDAGDDDLIYHYVDDEIDLAKVKVGDILPLDANFEVLATEERKEGILEHKQPKTKAIKLSGHFKEYNDE